MTGTENTKIGSESNGGHLDQKRLRSDDLFKAGPRLAQAAGAQHYGSIFQACIFAGRATQMRWGK